MKKIIVFLICLFSTASFAAEIDSNTVLLLQSDTIDGDTSFQDSSNLNHFVNANGGIHHKSDQAKFNSTSIYFDGVDDYIETSVSSEWAFGNGDFTIDFWIYDPLSSTTTISGQGPTPGINSIVNASYDQGGWLLYYYPGSSLVIRTNVIGIYTALDFNGSPQLTNTWNHIAIVRHAGSLNMYINGVNQPLVDGPVAGFEAVSLNVAGSLIIGKYNDYYLNSFLDELHISGVARWTDNFTPPTEPSVPGIKLLKFTPQLDEPTICNTESEGMLYYNAIQRMMMICDGNNWNEYTGPQGIQGIQGIQGVQGLQGLKGDQGAQGLQGPAGSDSPFTNIGCTTNQIIRYNGTAWVCSEAPLNTLNCNEGDTIKFISGAWICSSDI